MSKIPPIEAVPVGLSAPKPAENVAKKSAIAKPASAKPAVKKPVAKKPAVKKSVAKPAAKPVVKKPTAMKPVAKPAVKAKATPKAKEQEKQQKVKMERDSFTMPKEEYAQLAVLKGRLAALGQPAKKSELLRAGIKLLVAMSDNTLKTTMAKIPVIKTGRPKKK